MSPCRGPSEALRDVGPNVGVICAFGHGKPNICPPKNVKIAMETVSIAIVNLAEDDGPKVNAMNHSYANIIGQTGYMVSE